MDAAQKLKVWRGALTQAQSAKLLGISQPHYCDLERGRRRPGFSLMSRIKRLTGIPLDAWEASESHQNRATTSGPVDQASVGLGHGSGNPASGFQRGPSA